LELSPSGLLLGLLSTSVLVWRLVEGEEEGSLTGPTMMHWVPEAIPSTSAFTAAAWNWYARQDLFPFFVAL
jgi:hypothetical protein